MSTMLWVEYEIAIVIHIQNSFFFSISAQGISLTPKVLQIEYISPSRYKSLLALLVCLSSNCSLLYWIPVIYDLKFFEVLENLQFSIC